MIIIIIIIIIIITISINIINMILVIKYNLKNKKYGDSEYHLTLFFTNLEHNKKNTIFKEQFI